MNKRLLALAHNAAALSSCTSKHGAIIVKGGNILALGCNKKVTHPTSKRFAKDKQKITTIHAEQKALYYARGSVAGAILISVRLNGDRRSKPCEMCANLMYEAGIHSVWYYDGEKFVKERVRDLTYIQRGVPVRIGNKHIFEFYQ